MLRQDTLDPLVKSVRDGPRLRLQVKDDTSLRAPELAAPYAMHPVRATETALAIEGRTIALHALPGAPIDAIARAIARVPLGLRVHLVSLYVSPQPNAADASWSETYGLPVHSGMGAVASGSGEIVVYPHGLESLRADEGAAFVRGLMHELGHVASLRAWAASAADRQAWVHAIASDPGAPSRYATLSFQKSGLPDEDAAEATALYFLVEGTADYDGARAEMPTRFALLDARFAPPPRG